MINQKIAQSWDHRTILITGASKGLGADCANYFGERGARLILVARSGNEMGEIARKYKNTQTFEIDLLTSEGLEKLKVKLADFASQIDTVLHCAGGGLGFRDPLLSGTQLSQLLQLNVVAAAEINQFLIPSMKKKQRGNILHVGSIASTDAIASVGYNTCKAALAAYVRSLGKSLAGEGVIVTGILPGGFMSSGGAMDRLQKNNPAAYEEFLNHRLPRKKYGEFIEMIPMIEFLTSPTAGMMCGCMVPIDGGEGSSYLQ